MNVNVAELTAKAKVLLEALPYIQDFRGSTFVVKYGGSFMDDPDPVARTRVAFDIAFLAAVGINVVVVHGGGKAITKAMESSGLKANFINGLRVTDEAAVAIVKRTLDEIVNKDVCNAIITANGKPKGLAGDSVLVCQKLTQDDDGNTVHYRGHSAHQHALDDGRNGHDELHRQLYLHLFGTQHLRLILVVA